MASEGEIEDSDLLDAALFRYWIGEIRRSPSRVAIAIAHCSRPQEYRAALIALAKADRVNMPYPVEIQND